MSRSRRHDRTTTTSSSKDTDDYFGRVPYASLIALLLCVTGTILFCVMSYQAVNTTAQQMRNLPSVTVSPDFLDNIQLTFIVMGVSMAIVAVFLCAIGCLSTGATRTQTFDGARAICGGRLSCALGLFVAYMANLVWLVIMSITTVACAAYWLLSAACHSYIGDSRPMGIESGCLNLTIFNPVIGRTVMQSHLVVCNGELGQFCALTETASSWYYVAYFATMLVVVGLLHFCICLAANYARISTTRRTQEMYTLWQTETDAHNSYLHGEQANYTGYTGSSFAPSSHAVHTRPTNVYRPHVAEKSPLHMSSHPQQRGLLRPTGSGGRYN